MARNVITVNDALGVLLARSCFSAPCSACVHHLAWLLFTGFVGLDLMQSAFAKWCPMMAILRKAGLRDDQTRGGPAHPA